MKFFILILSVVLSFSFIKKDKPWYALKTGAFEISFPKEPVLDTNLLNTDIGILKIHSYMFDASAKKRSKNKLYSLVHIAYPSDLIHSNLTAQLDGVFRSVVDDAVANVHGKLLSEKKIDLGDYPGRVVEIDFQEGFAVILMHCYLVDNIMYTLQTISETSNYPNEDSECFLYSFKLVR